MADELLSFARLIVLTHFAEWAHYTTTSTGFEKARILLFTAQARRKTYKVQYYTQKNNARRDTPQRLEIKIEVSREWNIYMCSCNPNYLVSIWRPRQDHVYFCGPRFLFFFFNIRCMCVLLNYVFISSLPLGDLLGFLRFDHDVFLRADVSAVFMERSFSAQNVSLFVFFSKQFLRFLWPACFSWLYIFLPWLATVDKPLVPVLFEPSLTNNGISFIFLRCPLSSDWFHFVPRTSSRPSPAALFCFAPRFPLASG